MSPFKPAGDEARWRVIYRLLCDVPTGEVLTYEAMAEELELDPVRHRAVLAAAMRRAAREHEEVDRRAIESVHNEGYRVVDVNGQFRLAKAHNKRAGHQLEMAYSKATNVDLTNVDPEVRKAFEAVARGFLEQMEINRRLTARQQRADKALTAVSVRTERTEEELAELRARLERLETAA